jgi:hypothetical protein
MLTDSPFPEMDRDVCALVPQGHLPGHLPSERHRAVGGREIQTDPEIQSPGCPAH